MIRVITAFAGEDYHVSAKLLALNISLDGRTLEDESLQEEILTQLDCLEMYCDELDDSRQFSLEELKEAVKFFEVDEDSIHVAENEICWYRIILLD